jgi:hypothetical protein
MHGGSGAPPPCTPGPVPAAARHGRYCAVSGGTTWTHPVPDDRRQDHHGKLRSPLFTRRNLNSPGTSVNNGLPASSITGVGLSTPSDAVHDWALPSQRGLEPRQRRGELLRRVPSFPNPAMVASTRPNQPTKSLANDARPPRTAASASTKRLNTKVLGRQTITSYQADECASEWRPTAWPVRGGRSRRATWAAARAADAAPPLSYRGRPHRRRRP